MMSDSTSKFQSEMWVKGKDSEEALDKLEAGLKFYGILI